MVRYAATILLCLGFLPIEEAAGESTGKLSIFRWNQGFRAETTPVFEGELKESEFRALIAAKKLPESPEIFKGCYLAHFAPVGKTREPAQAGKPKSEIFRVCL